MSKAVEEIFLSTGLVYVAGIECPVYNLSVSYGVGMVPQATFTVPGDSELERLGAEDKVPVAMFYLDQWYDKSGREDKIEPKYCLLFDGEITGWEFSKSVNGRSITFTATSFVGTMGQMFAKFILGDATLGVSSTYGSGNSDQNILVPSEKHFPYSMYLKGLFAGGNAKVIDRPFDFIENLLLPMKLGGFPTYAGIKEEKNIAVNVDGSLNDDLQKLFNTNNATDRIQPGAYDKYLLKVVNKSAPMAFFVMYNHRVKFDQRWVASKIERFLDADTFNNLEEIVDPQMTAIMKFINQKTQLGVLGNLFGPGGSFLQIAQTYYSSVVYEILMLPTAQYVLVGNREDKLNSGIPTESTTSGKSEQRLANYISKPIAHFALPPACNILFPSMVPTITFSENYSIQTTRTIAGSPFLDFQTSKTTNQGSELMRQVATANAWPVAMRDLVNTETKGNVNNVLLYPEEYFKGPVVNHVTMPPWYRYIQEEATNFSTKQKKASTTNNVKEATGGTREQVDTKTFKDSTLPNYSNPVQDATRMYARYTRLKYYENRFESRNGSIGGMPFNPYIIPGYSFSYVGESGGNSTFTGLVGNVQHSIDASGGMSTSISYAYGRTMKEDFEIAIQEAVDTVTDRNTKNLSPALPAFHATAPLLLVKTLSDTLQQVEPAGDYYRNLFYQGVNTKKKTVFDFTKFFMSSKYANTSIPTKDFPNNPSDGYTVTLENTTEMDAERGSYNKAMQYVSRPVCTLDEYIEFINGGNGRGANIKRANLMPAEKYGVPVPARIRVYLSDEEGVTADASTMNRYINPTLTAPKTVFDFRRNWMDRILKYRDKVHNKEIQQ